MKKDQKKPIAQVTVLDNGFTVITGKIDNSSMVMAAVAFKVGSLDENNENNGISHFLEHMAFKGTKRFSAKEFALEVDKIGGMSNAWTGRDQTVYYLQGLGEDVERYVDLLADITQNSTFPNEELLKERGVIKQEITMYEDMAESSLSDAVFDSMFKEGSPLKRTILGPAENIDKISSEDLRTRMDDFYCPNNASLVIFGDIEHDKAVQMAKKYFISMGPNKNKPTPEGNVYQQALVLKEKKDLQQLKVTVDFNSTGFKQDRAGNVVRNIGVDILSRGMSSVVFQEIREKRGLSYTAGAASDVNSDISFFGLYADCSLERIEELYEAFWEILNHAVHNISDDEMSKYMKRYKVSQAAIKESGGSQLSRAINGWVSYGDPNAFQFAANIIEKITPQQVKEAMKDVIKNAQATIGVIGNYHDKKQDVEEASKKFLERIKAI